MKGVSKIMKRDEEKSFDILPKKAAVLR